MSTIILTKTSNCEESVETTVTITEATQFMLTVGKNISATIHFNGVLVAILSRSNPTYDAHVLGDYTVRIGGVCNGATVCTSPIVCCNSLQEGADVEQQILCDVVPSVGGELAAFDGTASWIHGTRESTDRTTCVADSEPLAATYVGTGTVRVTNATTDLIYWFDGTGAAGALLNGDAYQTYDRKSQTLIAPNGVVSGLGTDLIWDMAVDPTTGIIYAVEVVLSTVTNRNVYTFDPATGAFTFAYTMAVDSHHLNGITFNSSGEMFYAVRESSDQLDNHIYKVNKLDGTMISLFVDPVSPNPPGATIGSIGSLATDMLTDDIVLVATDNNHNTSVYDGVTGVLIGNHPCLVDLNGTTVGLVSFDAGDMIGSSPETSTKFIRHYLYDDDGTVVLSTYDTELDGVTGYTTVGDVSECAGDELSVVEVNVTPIDTVVTNAGVTADGAAQVSVLNVGIAPGVFNGSAMAVGVGRTYTAYFDPVTNESNRIASMAYDATGTTFDISVTP